MSLAASRTKEFRGDIQFLRGLAIVAVLAFHLQSRILPAGFVGVDIFFVLSGFLMGSLYDMERISAWEFYLRRARRILPAYFATILLTTMVAALIVLPHELRDIVASALYASVLAGNIGPWTHASYFDKSYFSPLLHLWSLGVEAQFYLFFPLMAWLWRVRPWVIVVAAVVSLATCVVMAGVSPKTAFFLTPFRLWEFAAGFFAAKALAAYPGLAQASRSRSWIGAAAVVALVLMTFMPIPETRHPGPAAVAITVAVVLILLFRLPTILMRSPIGRGGIWLGTYSYSIYLVHFPVIAFYLYAPFGGGVFRAPSLAEMALLIAITLGLSVALYHLVEQPFRRIRSARSFWVGQGAVAVGVAGLVIIAPLLQERRFTAAQKIIFAAWTDRSEYRCGKLERILQPNARSCTLTSAPKGGPTLLLVGNSHADALKTTFARTADAHGATLRLMVENCALGEGDCAPELVAREALHTGARTVVLHSSPGSMSAQAVSVLVRLGQRDGFDVVLIDPVPVWPYSVPQALYDANVAGDPPRLHQSLDDYGRSNASFVHGVDLIHAPNFRRFEIAEIFCRPDCAIAEPRTGAPLYFDGGHLTLTGARWLKPIFLNIVTRARRDNLAVTPVLSSNAP